MLQILQSLSTGHIDVAEVPSPAVRAGHLLIATRRSLISAGTERMLLSFGKGNLVQKAMQQPERVRQVIDKARTDGVLATYEAIRSKLDQPIPLGYSNAGVVLDVGAGVTEFKVGDRVVSNGSHAEVVCVPWTMCARIPDGLSEDSAAATVVGAIALQGVRLAAPTLGETVAVIGLGLIGLMTVQILRANGCRVIGIDLDPAKLKIAQSMGAIPVDVSAGADPVAAGMAATDQRGCDAVLITAATKSNDPVTQAAKMSRKRGRIVLVGVAGLELNRADFYEKELSFQVSCSYGPGSYDPSYVERHTDYPLGFVRWTVKRNFEAVLELMAAGALTPASLISHRVDINNAQDAYEILSGDKAAMGILLQYPDKDPTILTNRRVSLTASQPRNATPGKFQVGVIGAGNYASRVFLPLLAKSGAKLKTLVSQSGYTGYVHGQKNGFEATSTDADAVIADPSIDTIVIATRHDSHAKYALAALQAGKNVFVEKPLALTLDDVDRIERAYRDAQVLPAKPVLMVGFNRRFSPLAIKMKSLLSGVTGPKTFIYTANAGAIPPDHWSQDLEKGGGRIAGEACHFLDFLRFLVGAPISNVVATRIGDVPGAGIRDDRATLTVSFQDGSHGSVHYFANGATTFPRERVEAFCAGRTLVLENWLKLRGYGWPKFSTQSQWSKDSGHANCLQSFGESIRLGKPEPIPADEIFEVSRWIVRAASFDQQ